MIKIILKYIENKLKIDMLEKLYYMIIYFVYSIQIKNHI